MISIKDYAKQKNVSYEAVRKQLVRYKDELQSHITTKNRMRFLDDYAVNFLDQKRASSPIIIVQMDKDEEIECLKNENADLNRKIAMQAETIATLAQWKAEHSLAIAAAEASKQMLETKVADAEEKYSRLVVAMNELETSKTALDFVVDDLEHQLSEQKQTALETALQHKNELEELKTHYNAQIALESDKWKSKSLFERLFKK